MYVNLLINCLYWLNSGGNKYKSVFINSGWRLNNWFGESKNCLEV